MKTVIHFFITSSQSATRTKIQLSAAIMLSIAGGATGIALLAIVANVLSRHAPVGSVYILAVACLGLCLGFCRAVAQYLLTKCTIETLVSLRMALCREIATARLAKLEQIGNARLLACFTETMPTISAAMVQLPNVVLCALSVAGTAAYMAWLSWEAFALMIVAGSAAVAVSRRMTGAAQKEFGKAHGFYRTLLAGFRGLVDGAKELKLHRARRSAFLAEELDASMQGLASHRNTSSLLYSVADAWTIVAIFATLGIILRLTRNDGPQVATGFVLAILYLTPAVQGILAAIPTLSHAQYSVDNIAELRRELLTAADVARDGAGGVALPFSNSKQPEFIELSGVEYRYNDSDERSFQLGPIDLSLGPNETVFITGGNGSGKTTLIKVLAGLYWPDRGNIRVGGAAIQPHQADDYRQNFSVVFADFHLFEKLHGFSGVDGEAAFYIEQFRLSDKVQVHDGRFSTIKLSQGQRKRLALVTAYLEDRPIYVFDEWAADQDAEFRNIFYDEILAGLKRRGKTVVVVTHDDRYFDRADRVIRLEYGRDAQHLAPLYSTAS